MSLDVNVSHTFSLSPALEALVMSIVSGISQKVDALKESTDTKLGELAAEITSLSAEVADLNTKIADPAEIADIENKLDANKAAVDAVVVNPPVA